MIKKNINKRLIDEILSWELSDCIYVKKHYKSEKIPRIFRSLNNYRKSFEPLLLEETREQLRHLFNKNKNLGNNKNGEIFNFYIKNGKFLLIVKFLFNSINQFQNGSFVIIYLNKCNLSQKLIFGIILEIKDDFKIIKIEIGISNKSDFLIHRQKISIFPFSHISNIFSYIKEYDVIYSLEKIPLKIKNIILSGLYCKKKVVSKSKNNLYNYHLVVHFNQSQTNAILGILDKEISLIQGPPGTGKTRTVLGIISLLCQYSNINFKSEKIFKPNQQKTNIDFLVMKRLIVCATANAAVDENAMRNSIGFMYQRIKKSNSPYSIIRMGPNYHFLIDHMSLDNLALMWASEHDINIKFWSDNKIIQKSRNHILKKGKVIYTTLACTGYSVFDRTKLSEIIIIDEAAQAIEIDTLIPIRNTCKKLIMIGDVQQLPATIFSKTSILFNYDRSLFKRLQLQEYPVEFLETQYRMHPQISSFPARKFYKNGLKDSENVACMKKLHSLRCFGPYIFFDAKEGNEKNHMNEHTSWCNLDETRIITFLIKSLICLYSNVNLKSIGIITGYNGQIKELQAFELNEKFDLKQQINTVDGFQGKEKDFIIFSCVRSRFERGIGFLSDCRRINVAFTRAKMSFWVVGNLSTLFKDNNWKEIILDAQRRCRFFSFRKPFERASRRLIYWSVEDEENYSFDGEFNFSISFSLFVYLKKILKRFFKK
nr:component of a tRNA splicing complex, sen1 [Cryptomonas curvata]